MSATDSQERKILKNILLGTPVDTFTPYIGLSTSDPGESGLGLAEPVIGGAEGYARVDLTNANGIGESGWTSDDIDTATGSVANAREIIFPSATGAWGILTHWFIADSSTGTGDSILAYGVLSNPRDVTLGERLIFAPGSLVMQAD
jgi:hypothetical protein